MSALPVMTANTPNTAIAITSAAAPLPRKVLGSERRLDRVSSVTGARDLQEGPAERDA